MWKYFFMFFVCFDVALFQSTSEFVVTSTESAKENRQEENVSILLDTVLYEMDISSNVSNRFAKTLVTSKVKNPNTKSQETSFTVVLPEKAFISEFVLVIGNKSYKAYVREKEEAKQIYELAKLKGQTAGHVATSAKSANEFTISVNVEAEAKAQFLLTFEELLERKNEQYELILDIHPGQIVERLNLEVHINESRPLRFVRTPNLRTSNEISKAEEDFNSTDIEVIGKTAVVKFQPTVEEQKEIAVRFNGKESVGVSGQFVVQYDVERDTRGGEVLLQDGYFVHFFAPDNLEPIPKHIVFVLDTSGSMGGQKIEKLQEAMKNILGQLQPEDYVSLVEFNSGVNVWNLHNTTKQAVVFNNYKNPFEEINDEFFLPKPLSANTNESINKAKDAIDQLYAGGDTNILGALETALVLLKTFADTKEDSTQNLQPIIMFLTDGDSVGGAINKPEEIFKIITELNKEYAKATIYTLSFGDEANKDFLRKLSLKNSGFSRHITVSAFTSFQLQNFYNEISVPLMSNITFEYADAANVTRTEFPVFFKGTEIAICGVYDVNNNNPLGDTKIQGTGNSGDVSFVPTIEEPVSSLERLWAYLTVKEILGKRETASQIEQIRLKNQAIELALKYSFVTEVTSLVVVRPDKEWRPYLDTERENIPTVDRQQGALGAAGVGGPQGRPQPVAAPESAFMDIRVQEDVFSTQLAGGAGYPHKLGSTTFASHPPYKQALIVGGQGGYMPNKSKKKKVHKGPSKHDPATTYKPNFSTTPLPNVEDALTWLRPALNPNGTLSIGEENYKLGDNAVLSIPKEKCAKTPINGTDTGICTLLKACPEVYPYLRDFQTYKQYFCAVEKEYAGVCCPVK